MTTFPGRRRWRVFRLALLLATLSVAGLSGRARAVEVGEPAPGFTLPATTGRDISLGDFRGKQWVLLEFYGADFSPT
jgi:AhpC/TSA family